MKAKEYFKNYKEKQLTDKWEVALIRQFEAMFQEVKQIQNNRNAKSDNAIISILNETNNKANSFIRMVNKEENRGIYNNAFKIFIQEQMPEFAKMIGWS